MQKNVPKEVGAETKNGFVALLWLTSFWWPALDKNYNRTKLSKLQRRTCLGVTGSIRSTPSKALSVLLHLHPIDIHIKLVASCTAARLKAAGCLSERSNGHGQILRSLGNIETDLLTTKVHIHKSFKTGIPDQKEWDHRLINNKCTIL